LRVLFKKKTGIKELRGLKMYKAMRHEDFWFAFRSVYEKNMILYKTKYQC